MSIIRRKGRRRQEIGLGHRARRRWNGEGVEDSFVRVCGVIEAGDWEWRRVGVGG